MPKRPSLWKRETDCLVCEHKMINYQAMAKSQSVEYDDWLVGHSKGIGEYDRYPSTLKTTICPNCLTASNEYSFAVGDYKYFSRSVRKNNLLVEMYQNTADGRYKILAGELEALHEECAIYDRKKGKPPNMRRSGTLEKIWSQRERYAEPFFTMMFAEPRDYAMALVCFAMDRHCQMLRIGYENDVEYDPNDPSDVHNKVKAFFEGTKLDMKTAQTRLFYIAINYQQCVQFLDRMVEDLSLDSSEKHEELKTLYHQEAFDFFRYSEANEDMTAIPLELKEGGMGYLLCRFHREAGDEEEARKWLRVAKRYADNTLKRISTTNQQHFVNWVDALYKELFEPEEEAASK